MSTKKDKFSIKDKFYMELALDLARAREGLTGPNPSVGCVIVKNDELISIGQTSFNGRPHAELNAIKNSFTNLKGSTMYLLFFHRDRSLFINFYILETMKLKLLPRF